VGDLPARMGAQKKEEPALESCEIAHTRKRETVAWTKKRNEYLTVKRAAQNGSRNESERNLTHLRTAK